VLYSQSGLLERTALVAGALTANRQDCYISFSPYSRPLLPSSLPRFSEGQRVAIRCMRKKGGFNVTSWTSAQSLEQGKRASDERTGLFSNLDCK